MFALSSVKSATQSAPPWPLTTPLRRRNPRLSTIAPISDDEEGEPANDAVNQKVEVSLELKEEDVNVDVVHIKDTWPALALVKFEPDPPADARQRFDSTDDDVSARIAGICIASASSSAQSLEVGVPTPALGPAATQRRRGRSRGSKNRRVYPVVDPDAPAVIKPPSKWGGIHDNMGLRERN